MMRGSDFRHLTRFRRRIAATCLCLLVLAAVPVMAVSPGDPVGVFALRNAASGGYLGFADGAVVIQPEQDAGALWELQLDHAGRSGEYFRLRSLSGGDVFLHLRGGAVVVGPVGPGWLSAAWGVSEVGSEPLRRVTNRETAKPLYAQAGGPQVGDIDPAARFGLWQLERYQDPLPEPTAATAATSSPPGSSAALASAPRIVFKVQNFSDDTVGLYIEIDGTPEPVLELPPRSEVAQETPVGAVWHMASGDDWVSAFRVGSDVDQVWQYRPRR